MTSTHLLPSDVQQILSEQSEMCYIDTDDILATNPDDIDNIISLCWNEEHREGIISISDCITRALWNRIQDKMRDGNLFAAASLFSALHHYTMNLFASRSYQDDDVTINVIYTNLADRIETQMHTEKMQSVLILSVYLTQLYQNIFTTLTSSTQNSTAESALENIFLLDTLTDEDIEALKQQALADTLREIATYVKQSCANKPKDNLNDTDDSVVRSEGLLNRRILCLLAHTIQDKAQRNVKSNTDNVFALIETVSQQEQIDITTIIEENTRDVFDIMLEHNNSTLQHSKEVVTRSQKDALINALFSPTASLTTYHQLDTFLQNHVSSEQAEYELISEAVREFVVLTLHTQHFRTKDITNVNAYVESIRAALQYFAYLALTGHVYASLPSEIMPLFKSLFVSALYERSMPLRAEDEQDNALLYNIFKRRASYGMVSDMSDSLRENNSTGFFDILFKTLPLKAHQEAIQLPDDIMDWHSIDTDILKKSITLISPLVPITTDWRELGQTILAPFDLTTPSQKARFIGEKIRDFLKYRTQVIQLILQENYTTTGGITDQDIINFCGRCRLDYLRHAISSDDECLSACDGYVASSIVIASFYRASLNTKSGYFRKRDYFHEIEGLFSKLNDNLAGGRITKLPKTAELFASMLDLRAYCQILNDTNNLQGSPISELHDDATFLCRGIHDSYEIFMENLLSKNAHLKDIIRDIMCDTCDNKQLSDRFEEQCHADSDANPKICDLISYILAEMHTPAMQWLYITLKYEPNIANKIDEVSQDDEFLHVAQTIHTEFRQRGGISLKTLEKLMVSETYLSAVAPHDHSDDTKTIQQFYQIAQAYQTGRKAKSDIKAPLNVPERSVLHPSAIALYDALHSMDNFTIDLNKISRYEAYRILTQNLKGFSLNNDALSTFVNDIPDTEYVRFHKTIKKIKSLRTLHNAELDTDDIIALQDMYHLIMASANIARSLHNGAWSLALKQNKAEHLFTQTLLEFISILDIKPNNETGLDNNGFENNASKESDNKDPVTDAGPATKEDGGEGRGHVLGESKLAFLLSSIFYHEESAIMSNSKHSILPHSAIDAYVQVLFNQLSDKNVSKSLALPFGAQKLDQALQQVLSHHTHGVRTYIANPDNDIAVSVIHSAPKNGVSDNTNNSFDVSLDSLKKIARLSRYISLKPKNKYRDNHVTEEYKNGVLKQTIRYMLWVNDTHAILDKSEKRWESESTEGGNQSKRDDKADLSVSNNPDTQTFLLEISSVDLMTAPPTHGFLINVPIQVQVMRKPINSDYDIGTVRSSLIAPQYAHLHTLEEQGVLDKIMRLALDTTK